MYTSGLKGIDFGSFPLISKWVKEVINSSIVDYITPRYVSINVPAWLMPVGDDEHVVNYY
jgi:Ca2+-dependent lipid-binding protein